MKKDADLDPAAVIAERRRGNGRAIDVDARHARPIPDASDGIMTGDIPPQPCAGGKADRRLRRCKTLP